MSVFTWLMIVSMVLTVVIGVPFVLWWWKIADRWADDEAKRFGRVKDAEEQQDEAVVIKDFDRPADA